MCKLPPEEQIGFVIYCNFYFGLDQLRSQALASPIDFQISHIAKPAMAIRSTSVADDEGLCLGNILGLDPEPLVKARTGEERMKLIWETVIQDAEHATASYIFWKGPKLSTPGFRWAAATLMTGELSLSQWGQHASLSAPILGWSSLGLQVRLPAIVFQKPAAFTEDADTGELRVYFSVASVSKHVHHFLLLPGQSNPLFTNYARGRCGTNDSFPAFPLVILLPDASLLQDDRVIKGTEVKVAIPDENNGQNLHIVFEALLLDQTLPIVVAMMSTPNANAEELSYIETKYSDVWGDPTNQGTFVPESLWNVD